MAANILQSDRAVQISVFVVRAFVRQRQMLLDNKALRKELEEMKRQTDDRLQIIIKVAHTTVYPSTMLP